MSVANETPTMQVRTPQQIAKACAKLPDFNDMQRMEQAIHIALVEREIGQQVDYVLVGELEDLEGTADYLCPDFEIEEDGELKFPGRRWPVADVTIMADCVDPSTAKIHGVRPFDKLNRNLADITCTCTIERVGSRLLATFEYEGVACG